MKTALIQRIFVGTLVVLWSIGSSVSNAVEPVRMVPTQVGPLASASLDSLHLAQATHLWLQDDLAGAAEMLATIDLREDGSFARSDRAAFLLGAAYLQLGERQKFVDIAATANPNSDSPYRQWLAYANLMVQGDASANLEFPGAKVLVAAHLVESGEAKAAKQLLTSFVPDERFALQHAYLEALTANTAISWQTVAAFSPNNESETELVALAGLALATIELAAGQNPEATLASIPGTSPAALQARQTRVQLALAKGDTAAARTLLNQVVYDDLEGFEARRTQQFAGQLAASNKQWNEALVDFYGALENWDREATWLQSLEDPDHAAKVWALWQKQNAAGTEIPWPQLAWSEAMASAAQNAADLSEKKPVKVADIASTEVSETGAGFAHFHAPNAEQWARWQHVSQSGAQNRAQLRQWGRDLKALETQRNQQLSYLDLGAAHTGRSTATLNLAVAELDRLVGNLHLALADLDSTKNQALFLFAQRTATMVDEMKTSLSYLQAARHFHTTGPSSAQYDHWPEGAPTPAKILDLEEALTTEMVAFLEMFNNRVPILVNRSCDEIWRPRLADGLPALRLAMMAQQRRSIVLAADIDSTANALAVDREINSLQLKMARGEATGDSLRTALALLQTEITQEVMVAGQNMMAKEREGLDYQRHNALYWLAVNDAKQNDEAIPTTSLAPAMAGMRDFLMNYPDSRARGETRFRLADLELLNARVQFRAQMTNFLGKDPTSDDLQNKALAPFIDSSAAVALYQDILTEDADFPYRAAVMFQLGMIMSDDGDPQSTEILTALVNDYPDSPYNQEAWLRLGDEQFESRNYAASVPYFSEAARGNDGSLRAIALYKMGWSHFEQDSFDSAANSFGRLLDHYATGATNASNMRSDTDLADEAEEYLVHSLIRAGGVEAYEDHFAKTGDREYEADILIAMGYRFSSVSLYGDAIACDELWLEKFGHNEQALGVAERLVASHVSWNKPDSARDRHVTWAGHFLPDQPWYAAQTDSALQARSQDFARQAYERAAVYHHERARKQDTTAEWQAALDHYDTYLAYWPEQDAAAHLQLQAGDVAFRLNQYETALVHFKAAANHPAAAADTSDFQRLVAWETVAVTDAWYKSSVVNTTGTDSLARRLIAETKSFSQEYPADTRVADLLWRQGQLAYAHQWYAEAAVDLATLTRDFPEDENALTAIRMSGDAWYRLEKFPAAGAAYEQTLELARVAQDQELVATMEPLVPACYYQNAQGVAAADTVAGLIAAAPLFETVANRWPTYEHADLALYRAGLGYENGGDAVAATEAWEQLLEVYPTSTYARDSSLRIATAHENAGNWQASAVALNRFSATFPDDPDAASALLKSGEMLALGGDVAGATAAQNQFLKQFPGEAEDVMEIREKRIVADLDGLAPNTSPDTLADLPAYLALAKANPDLASNVVLARIDYLRATPAHKSYTAMKLNQPLPAAITAKQKALEELLNLYAACAKHGDGEYTRAAAFQMGEAITHFGDALLESERPAELQGDDLLAYEEILEEQSWPFYDRGEAAWTDLLKQSQDADSDPGQWLAQTRAELWPRVAQRFMHMPEADYPLVAAVAPKRAAAEE